MDTATAEGRAEVARAVNARISQLRLPAAKIAKLSGLSVNTIRGVTDGSGIYTKSTLVALSAVLDWDSSDPEHLVRRIQEIQQTSHQVLAGDPQERSEPFIPPTLRDLAEFQLTVQTLPVTRCPGRQKRTRPQVLPRLEQVDDLDHVHRQYASEVEYQTIQPPRHIRSLTGQVPKGE
jgi:hypothetical protein